MFQLLLSAYSTISIKDAALFLGMNEDDATNCKYFHYPRSLRNWILIIFCTWAVATLSFLLLLTFLVVLFRRTTARLDCRPCLSDAYCEEATCCDRAET